MKKTKIIRCQSRICVGGPAYQTIYLSAFLDNNRFETILVGGKNNPDEKSMLPLADELGVKYKIIKQMGREISFFDDLISLFKLYKLIRKEKPEIVHTHTAKAGTIGRVAAWLAGVPKIYHTFHGHVFEGYFNKTVTNIYIFIEKLLAKISTKIIVISDAQKDDIVNTYKIAESEKVIEIPLGFDWNSFFKPSYYKLRERFNISNKKTLIAIIGRIVPIKYHELFMEIAFELLKRDEDKYHFILIGDGELKETLRENVKLKNYSNSFTFSGWLNLNRDVYKEIDMVILTSRNEGTPVTIIESLVAGVPVIAADVGGVRDIMSIWNKEALVVEHNKDLFVKKIETFIKTGISVSGVIQEKVRKRYGVERLINDIQILYEK